CIFEIDVVVSGERAVFVPDHRGSTTEGDSRHLPKRDLHSRRSANQDAAHLIDVIPEVALIANIDGVALPALDVLGDVLPANARSNSGLNICHCEAVTCRLRPVDFDIDVEALRDLLCKDRTRLRLAGEHILYL